MPPDYVKPCVKRGTTDAIDAEAICAAVTRPGLRFVPVRTEDQQAALMRPDTGFSAAPAAPAFRRTAGALSAQRHPRALGRVRYRRGQGCSQCRAPCDLGRRGSSSRGGAPVDPASGRTVPQHPKARLEAITTGIKAEAQKDAVEKSSWGRSRKSAIAICAACSASAHSHRSPRPAASPPQKTGCGRLAVEDAATQARETTGLSPSLPAWQGSSGASSRPARTTRSCPAETESGPFRADRNGKVQREVMAN